MSIQDQNRIAELERRVAELEKALGVRVEVIASKIENVRKDQQDSLDVIGRKGKR